MCWEFLLKLYDVFMKFLLFFCLLLFYNYEKNLWLIDYILLLVVKFDVEKVFNYIKLFFWWSGKLFDRRKKNIYWDFFESFFFVL